LSCAEVAKGIKKGIDLLSTSQADLPERQRSVRSLYDYSWSQLTENEQRLLRKLSVFRGGFQHEAAYQVAQAFLTDLDGLVNKSFLRKNPSNRFRFHPMVRQYAYEKLTQSDEIGLASHLHLKYFVDFVQHAGSRLNQSQQSNWLKLLDRELGNLRTAFQTAQAGGEGHAELALRLATALGRYWELRGYWKEGQEWLTMALEMSKIETAIPVEIKVKALFWSGRLAGYLGENSTVSEMAQAGLALCQQDPAPNNLGLVLTLFGRLARNAGNYALARQIYQESLELFRKTGNFWGICSSLNNLFRINYRLNAYEEATDLARQSLALAKEAGDQANISLALDFLGVVAHDQGDYEQGKAFLSESLAISRSIGARFMIGHAIYWLGRIARSQTKPELASALFQESLAHYQEIGSKWGIAVSLQGLGVVENDRENIDRADELLRESLAVLQEVGDIQLMAYVKINLGEVALAKQEYERASSEYRESISALLEVKDRWLIALAMGGLASLAVCQGEHERAATLIGIEDGIRREIGTPRSPAENAAFTPNISTLRDQLTPAQLRKLRSQGLRMARHPLDDIAQYALKTPA
jgi:tetratricopeptide (TPR) repeat protein